MRIEHLECLIAIAETGSITKTGHKLFTTQQNISKMLKQLEDEIGYPLFTRSAKGVSLTKEGEIMLVFAQQTLENFFHAKNQIYKLQANTLSGELHLHSFYLGVNTILAKIANNFRRYYPNIKLYLYEDDTLKVLQNSVKYADSIGIVPITVDKKLQSLYEPYINQLKIIPILSDRYVCITSKHSPIAQNKNISLKQFLKHKLILSPQENETDDNLFYHLFEFYGDPNIVMRTSNGSLFTRLLVENPDCVSIGSKRSFELNSNNLYQDLIAIPFRENMNYNICIVYNLEKKCSAAHHALVEFISTMYDTPSK